MQPLEIANFKKATIADRHLIEPFIHGVNGHLSCEYCFTNLFIWQDAFEVYWQIWNDLLLVFDKEDKHLLMPLGPEPEPSELKQIIDCFELNLFYDQVPKAYLDTHPDYSQYFTAQPAEGVADYLHLAKNLAELSGTKLRKKRNLISQFKRNHPSYELKDLNPNMAKECLGLNELLEMGKETPYLDKERMAMRKAVENFSELNLTGKAIYICEELIAFTIFSWIKPDTAVIHFEKANRDFKGAAQAIDQLTAEYLQDKCVYINREQDLDLPGLRQAKRSYDPETILVNYRLYPIT